MRKYQSQLLAHQWHYLILDEGHTVRGCWICVANIMSCDSLSLYDRFKPLR